MQVKKFEARTMKEALEMVKSQLGPDAVILSVRDNNKSFGLVGDGSFEITAAVSEQTLHKKKFVESKLREQDREKFLKSSARTQKEVIEKFVSKQIERNTPRAITEQRYIDIDSDSANSNIQGNNSSIADARIREAAQRAWGEFQTQESNFKRSSSNPVLKKIGMLFPKPHSFTNTGPSANPSSSEAKANEVQSFENRGQEEIQSLKEEIENLRQLVSQFQSIPQQINKSTYPGSEYGIPYEFCYLFERLRQEGMQDSIIANLLQEGERLVPQLRTKSRGMIDGLIAKLILEKTEIITSPAEGKIHCFLGPAGSGKTSILVKMASQLAVGERKKIAILTTDTLKVGAAEQLRIYSQILNVPFGILRDTQDWNSIGVNLQKFDAILVDFPGVSIRKPEDFNLFRKIIPPLHFNAVNHLVLSVTSKDTELTEMGRRFSLLNYRDVIFTCLDESVHFGSIFNFMSNFDIPLHSFSLGAKIPEDFEFATKERVLDLIFKITQNQQQEKAAL